MAIVSRSCRLAGFSASPPRALLSSPPSSYLFLAFFLIFARTFYPSSPSSHPHSHSLESILSRHRVPPLSPPDRKQARRVFLFQVLTGRYLEENSLFLARDRRNSNVYIYIYTPRLPVQEERKPRARFEGTKCGSGRDRGKRGSGRGQERRRVSSSNVARREIASFPNPLCVCVCVCVCSGLIGLHQATSSFSYISHPRGTPPNLAPPPPSPHRLTFAT